MPTCSSIRSSRPRYRTCTVACSTTAVDLATFKAFVTLIARKPQRAGATPAARA
jgi:hypothetical protein